MAIASKTFSVVSYETREIEIPGYETVSDIITQINWKIVYTDDSTPAKSVEVLKYTAFDPYHLVKGTPNPRTGTTTTFVPFENITNATLAGWAEALYNADPSLKTMSDYEANYLLTGEDPENNFTTS
tara:strand:+ start:565 stop:945 length:381 start_codon:yes stop_codon:yes gene_type:complete